MIAGTFSVRAAVMSFVVLAAGGFLVGLVIAYAIGRLRDWLRRADSTDAFIEVTVSLMTPYAAYLAAGALGLSSILAVVAAGLYSGWRDPIRMDVETRQTTWAVWSVLLYWLNGLAFVLLGLQLPALIASVADAYTPSQLALFTGAISGAAILGRLVWIFPNAYLPFVFYPPLRRREKPPSWQAVLVAGWAGMRGTITLAAALSLPLLQADGSPLPGRDIVIFLSFGVIAVTLLVQGTTLEALICRLGLRADDTQLREEQHARVTAVTAGLNSLRSAISATSAQSTEERAALALVVAEYEHRLAELAADGETQASAHRHRTASRAHRLRAIRAEREAIDDLWLRDIITDETHRPLQQLLDHEEAMLQAGSPDTKS
jgi:CPA1 family monovalent cation:H+ antiporter